MIGKLTSYFKKLEEKNQKVDHDLGDILDDELENNSMIIRKRRRIEILRKKRKAAKQNRMNQEEQYK